MRKSRAQEDWETFCSFRFKGTFVEQTKDRIRIKQKISLSNKGSKYLVVIVGTIWIVPALVMFCINVEWAVVAFLYLLVAALPLWIIMMIVAPFLKRWTTVDIYRQRVVVNNGNEQFDIPLASIRNIDVRPNAHFFAIYIWKGPVPIMTLTEYASENATAIKEGMVAAVVLMNPERSSSSRPEYQD